MVAISYYIAILETLNWVTTSASFDILNYTFFSFFQFSLSLCLTTTVINIGGGIISHPSMAHTSYRIKTQSKAIIVHSLAVLAVILSSPGLLFLFLSLTVW